MGYRLRLRTKPATASISSEPVPELQPPDDEPTPAGAGVEGVVLSGVLGVSSETVLVGTLGISLGEHPIGDGTGDGDVIFSHGGMVTLAGLCSQTTGTIQMTGNPSNVPGPNCWCHVISAQPNGGQQSSISNAPWVLQSTGGTQTSGDCRLSNNGQWVDVECTYHCAKNTFVSEWDYYLNNLMFTQSCVYPTLTYHNCPDGGSYTDPAQQSLSANSGTSITLASSCVSGGVQVASPYTFGGWYCVDTGNNVSVSLNSDNTIHGLPIKDA